MNKPRIITPEQRALRARVQRAAVEAGIGTDLKKIIHRTIDASPLPQATKAAIKSCGGCRSREKKLNQFGKAVKRFFARTPQMQPPPSEPKRLD